MRVDPALGESALDQLEKFLGIEIAHAGVFGRRRLTRNQIVEPFRREKEKASIANMGFDSPIGQGVLRWIGIDDVAQTEDVAGYVYDIDLRQVFGIAERFGRRTGPEADQERSTDTAMKV